MSCAATLRYSFLEGKFLTGIALYVLCIILGGGRGAFGRLSLHVYIGAILF